MQNAQLGWCCTGLCVLVPVLGGGIQHCNSFRERELRNGLFPKERKTMPIVIDYVREILRIVLAVLLFPLFKKV